MKAYYQAEKMKYRRTFMWKIVIGFPLLSTVFAALLTWEYFAIDSYNWWYLTLFPAMTALVCGIIGGKDRKFQNRSLFSLPCDMGKIWDAKMLVGIAASGVAVLCVGALSVVTGEFMKAVLHVTFAIELSVFRQATGCLIIWGASLWQVPFCLLLSQKIGILPMLMLHVTGSTLVAALVSLKPWFFLFPGAIMPRLMCAVLKILPNGLPAVEGSVTYSPELIGAWNLWIGIPMSLLWFLIFWRIGRKWFERQVA